MIDFEGFGKLVSLSTFGESFLGCFANCCLFFMFFMLPLVMCRYNRRQIGNCHRVLFVIAHPDDESMFFSPTIIGLIQSGAKVYLLCITTGDYGGIGYKRKDELYQAIHRLGILQGNITIINHGLLRDGFVSWNHDKLSQLILKYIKNYEADTVITFDELGISSHPNHIACSHALQNLYYNGHISIDTQVLMLETVPPWRKYCVPLDAIFISRENTSYIYVSAFSAYISALRATLAHSSQMVWFRFLYILFSRYMFINTLKRLRI